MKAETETTFGESITRGVTFFLLLAVVLLFMSCGGGRNTSNLDVSEYQELEMVVDKKLFAVEHNWANPLNGARVDLLTNANYIRFKGDEVKVYLPYYGVRHSGGAYDSEGGILYEGPLNNLEIEENLGSSITMKFEGENGTEDLEFLLTLYPGGNVITNVSSSERQSISYQGRMKEMPEEALLD